MNIYPGGEISTMIIRSWVESVAYSHTGKSMLCVHAIGIGLFSEIGWS